MRFVGLHNMGKLVEHFTSMVAKLELKARAWTSTNCDLLIHCLVEVRAVGQWIPGVGSTRSSTFSQT